MVMEMIMVFRFFIDSIFLSWFRFSETVLRIIARDILSGFARFNVCAHFLQIRGKRFNLLLSDGNTCVAPNSCFLLHVLAVLFEELVEQHRVHCVVAHRVHVSIVTANHQIGATFLLLRQPARS